MRQTGLWIAAGCIVAVIGLRPLFSSGASPASGYKVIYSFTGVGDGGQPLSDLTLDAAGNLYGTTSNGGAGTACGSAGCGTVFELRHSNGGWKEEVLHSFEGGTDGEFPQGGVIFDQAGNLYGTTVDGGAGHSGTVFKLAPNLHGGWTESILHSFDYGGSGGTNPRADLVFDPQGNLYGVTPAGASGGKSCSENGCGALFELSPHTDGSWTETTIHVFSDNGSDGAVPSSGVVIDSVGDLYGATTYGGTGACKAGGYPLGPTFGCGAIYRATKSSGTWKETVLYSFDHGGGRGVDPSSGLTIDRAGHMLVATSAGGNGVGTLIELVDSEKNGWQQRVLYRFYNNPDGSQPAGRLEMDAKGDLFGVTIYGGTARAGTVFELRHSETSGGRERVLHSFAGGADGSLPNAGVVSDLRGHFFGASRNGGNGTGCDGGCGAVYEVKPR